MTIFRGTYLASITSLLLFAACSGQKTTEVSLILEGSSGSVKTLDANPAFNGFTPIVSSSGLITNRSCYFVHVTAPDLLVKGTEGGGGDDDDECTSDAPEVPGLGKIFGPFAYGSTAKIQVPAGSGRRFDLIGFINPYNNDPTCTKAFTTKVTESGSNRGKVTFTYGKYVIDYESPVKDFEKARSPFAEFYFFAISNTVNLSPGPQTVSLSKVDWNADKDRPQSYGGGCGGDRDLVFPYMHDKVIRTGMNPGFLDFKCVAGTGVSLEVKGSAVNPVRFPATGTLTCPASERIVFSNISLDPTGARTVIETGGWTRQVYDFKFFASSVTPLVEGKIELSSKYNAISHYTGSAYSHLQFKYSSLLGTQTSGIVLNDASSNTDLIAPFPEVGGPIHTVISDGSGGWYIGGSFYQVGSFPRSNIARVKADGSVDTEWNVQINGQVHALALHGSKLFVGGSFSSVGTNVNARNLVSVDASDGELEAWNADISGSVYALSATSTTLFAGGLFNISPNANLASFDINDLALTTTLNNIDVSGSVESLLSVGDTLYVGGNFASVNSSPRENLASFDLATEGWTSWSPDANNSVLAFAFNSSLDKLYVGGLFTTIATDTRNSIAAFDVSSGALDTNWNPNLNCSVNPCRVTGITVDSTRVYLAGIFDSLNGQPRKNIGAVASATGAATATWSPPVIGTGFKAIALSGTKLYAGGMSLEVGNTVPVGQIISQKKLGFAGFKSSGTSRELYLRRDYTLTDPSTNPITIVNKNELNKISISPRNGNYNKGAFEWNGNLASLNSNLLSAAGSYIENVIASKLDGVLEFFGLSYLGSFDVFKATGSEVYHGPSDNSVSGHYAGQDYLSTHDSGVHAVVNKNPRKYVFEIDTGGTIDWPSHPFSTATSFEVVTAASCMKGGNLTPIASGTTLTSDLVNSTQFQLKVGGVDILSDCTLDLTGPSEAFIFIPTGLSTNPDLLEGTPITVSLPGDINTVKSINLHVDGDSIILAILAQNDVPTSVIFTVQCSIEDADCGTPYSKTAGADRTTASFIARESDALFYVVGGQNSTVLRYEVDTQALLAARDDGFLLGTASGSVSLIKNLRDSNNGIDVPGEAMLLKGSSPSHHTAYRTRDAGLTWYQVYRPQSALLLDILPVHLDNGDSQMEPGFIILENYMGNYSITSQWGDGF